MLNCTCALPLPLAALVNEIQATFEAAVHVHVAVDAVTVTDPGGGRRTTGNVGRR
jgi:hypothetical protein